MRRRLNFPVLATPDDQYGLPELYTPFFEWAMDHPRGGVADWHQAIAGRKQAFDAYWQQDQWVEVEDAEIRAFVETVRQLTALFECSDCSQLLSYDRDEEIYFCPECAGQATVPSAVPAYWFVRRG
jgi:hypothetical protein